MPEVELGKAQGQSRAGRLARVQRPLASFIGSELKWAYLVLGGLAIGGLIAYLWARSIGVDWIIAWAPSLSTTMAGILLAVLLIDSAIQRAEARQRSRMRSLAYRQLRVAMVNHLGFLADMYKAATATMPPNQSVDPFSLFDDRYFAELAHLDFSKPAPVVAIVPMQWFDYVALSVQEFQSDLGRVADRYVAFLDPESVDLLERLVGSPFLGLLRQGPAVRGIGHGNRPYPMLAGDGVSDLARAYTADFMSLLARYHEAVPDESLPTAVHLTRNDVAPRVGSARIAIR